MKTIIIGGVAAGAGAAARLRRLDESHEIVLVERGAYISYANCGLPYHLGNVIANRETLLLMTPEKFSRRFAVDVRINCEATAIDRKAKTVSLRDAAGNVREERYDKLVLATGSSPLMPPLPGLDHPKVMRLWTIPDMDRVMAAMKADARRALVIGAGFIGLEVAENLAGRGIEVTVVEMMEQVLPTLDREMTTPLAGELKRHGIALELGRKVTAFKPDGAGLKAVLDDGRELRGDFAVMSIGVRPNSELAKAADLEVGERGHIKVDDALRTSDPDIFAAGDVVEVTDPILGGKTAIPLAGPANRQGRIIADNIAGRKARYSGTYGAAIVKVGDLSAASIGCTERRLNQAGSEYAKAYLHPASNAGYYPGGSPLHMKILFSPEGKIYGAQIVGAKGADKRIDVIGVAMRSGLDVRELAELELAYAPPFNSPKDPVNMAGMIAGNMLSGDSKAVYPDSLPASAQLIDVSEPEEYELGSVPGAKNIPLGSLRGRLGELDKSAPVVAACRVGLRGYIAERILRQNGFDAANLSGGYRTWLMFHPSPATDAEPVPAAAGDMKRDGAVAAHDGREERLLDVRALACPGPVVSLKKTVDGMNADERLNLLAPIAFEADLRAWLKNTGNTLLSFDRKPDHLEALIAKKGAAARDASAGSVAVSKGDSCGIVLFSNDLDKALACLIIACGMAAAGIKTSIFFTFWGLSVIRKESPPPKDKSLINKMFGWMLPKGAKGLTLSKMNMAGIGTSMMKSVMAKQNVMSLPTLLQQAKEMGVTFIACEMAMGVMGIERDELLDVDEVAGVASFVDTAKEGGNVLFI